MVLTDRVIGHFTPLHLLKSSQKVKKSTKILSKNSTKRINMKRPLKFC